MMNYMRSETYKLLKTKGIYITYAICIMLLILAALTLYYFGHNGKYFPYYRADFYYNNVFGMWLLIIMIGVIINLLLTNKESKQIMKQSIAFGIEKQTIYFGKYIVSLLFFVFICLISTVVMVVAAHLLMPENKTATSEFLKSLINFAPILLAGFTFGHTLNMSSLKEYMSGFIFVFVLLNLSTVAYLLKSINSVFTVLYEYSPKVLADRVLAEYMDETVKLSPDFWISGVIITVISLLIGYIYFKKRDF